MTAARKRSRAVKLPTKRDMMERMGDRPENWAGQCHQAATALAELISLDDAAVRRGYFTGRVASGAYFDGRPCQHSWVELREGGVIDPTRFAFTREKAWPLAVIEASLAAEEYDIGGCRSQPPMGPPPGPYESEGEPCDLECDSAEQFALMLGLPGELYGEGWLTVTLEQAHWLAHLPILEGRERAGTLSPFFAPELFDALCEAAKGALIPIDRLDWMLPERSEGRVRF